MEGRKERKTKERMIGRKERIKEEENKERRNVSWN